MTNTRLVAAVCTIGLLAAGPVFAQSNGPASSTMHPNAGSTAMPNSYGQSGTSSGSMGAPGSLMETGGKHASNATEEYHGGKTGMHHAARSSRHGTNESQNAAVDQLNEQSLNAAQQGHDYTVGSSYNDHGSSGMPPSNMPAGSGASTSSGSK